MEWHDILVAMSFYHGGDGLGIYGEVCLHGVYFTGDFWFLQGETCTTTKRQKIKEKARACRVTKRTKKRKKAVRRTNGVSHNPPCNSKAAPCTARCTEKLHKKE